MHPKRREQHHMFDYEYSQSTREIPSQEEMLMNPHRREQYPHSRFEERYKPTNGNNYSTVSSWQQALQPPAYQRYIQTHQAETTAWEVHQHTVDEAVDHSRQLAETTSWAQSKFPDYATVHHYEMENPVRLAWPHPAVYETVHCPQLAKPTPWEFQQSSICEIVRQPVGQQDDEDIDMQSIIHQLSVLDSPSRRRVQESNQPVAESDSNVIDMQLLAVLQDERVAEAELWERKCDGKNLEMVEWGVVVTLEGGARYLIQKQPDTDGIDKLVVETFQAMSSDCWTMQIKKLIQGSIFHDYIEVCMLYDQQTDNSFMAAERMISLE